MNTYNRMEMSGVKATVKPIKGAVTQRGSSMDASTKKIKGGLMACPEYGTKGKRIKGAVSG